MNKWTLRFLNLAQSIALWSEDETTKVGCVIVCSDHQIISYGYNGLPRRLSATPRDRHDRASGEKYFWFEHAERNAIYAAASSGRRTKGATMYLTWFPCVDCTRAIIQSGITRLIAEPPDFDHNKWGEDFRRSLAMLEEAGIVIELLTKENP